VQEVQVDAAMDDQERADELRVLGTTRIHSVPMEVAGVTSALGPEHKVWRWNQQDRWLLPRTARRGTLHTYIFHVI